MQLGVLPGPQLRRVDLACLEPEEVQPLAARPVVAGQPLQPLGEPGVLVEHRGHASEERLGLGAAAAVEQPLLQLGLDQPQLVALAVDAQEIRSEIRQQPKGRGLIVDEDPVPAAPGDLAADQNLSVLYREPRLVEHPLPLRPGRLEDPAHRQRLRAAADHLAARPRSGEEGQRIDDDRLARARLAGKDVQPRPELDRCLGQDGQVADVDLAQHAGCLLGLRPPGDVSAGAYQKRGGYERDSRFRERELVMGHRV